MPRRFPATTDSLPATLPRGEQARVHEAATVAVRRSLVLALQQSNLRLGGDYRLPDLSEATAAGLQVIIDQLRAANAALRAELKGSV